MNRLLLLLLISAHTALGQVSDSAATAPFPPKSNFKRGLIADFGFSPTLTRLPTLRSFFSANQIRLDASLVLFCHFGFGVRFNRLKLLAQNGFGLSSKTEDPISANKPDEFVAQTTVANYTGLFLGYDVLNARNRRLYVNVGLGGLEYGFNIYKRSNQTVPFQSILQTGQSGVVSSLLLRNVGYLDVNVEYAYREKRKLSIEYAIRLGYRSGTYAKAYESEAYLLTNAPKDRIGQIYLQTTLSLSANSDKFRIR